jgi:hypothetical protein
MSMTLSWADAFPEEESAQAARLLIHCWKQLVNFPATAFTAKLSEPKLTFILCEHLKSVSDADGRLTGRWGQENPLAKIDAAAGKIVKSYRTDIEYFSNRSQRVLRLIFEFKKIDNKQKSISQYCGTDGMRRFIDGEYACGEPVAFMAGIIIANRPQCLEKLRETLQAKATAQVFQWRGGTALTVQPSPVFPGMSEFDTEHLRPAEKLPPEGFVRICHIFLEFETHVNAKRTS